MKSKTPVNSLFKKIIYIAFSSCVFGIYYNIQLEYQTEMKLVRLLGFNEGILLTKNNSNSSILLYI